MTVKRVEDMDRLELIQELRKKAHPRNFHQIMMWNTEMIRKIILFYKESEQHSERSLVFTHFIGIDIGLGESITTKYIFTT